MENKVLGPAIRQGIQQGIQQGIEQGRREGIEKGVEKGMRQALKVLVKSRFGSLPRWASARIDKSSQQEIKDLIAGASAAPTLEDLFR
jgi:flagellar biosynthesis/type III secretory pathway protein FliH